MKYKVYLHWRPMVVLVASLALFLSACERPLQPDVPNETPTTLAPRPDLPTPLPPEPETPVGEPPVIELTPDQPTTEVPPEESAPPDETPATGPTTHVVQAGDTLGRIAQRYNVSVNDIAAANNLADINRLEIGQVLVIPVDGVGVQPTIPATTGEVVHVVQPGENLFRIALHYGVSLDALAAYNGIANPNVIAVGQQIRIPPSQ